MPKKKLPKKKPIAGSPQHKAWLEARVLNYINTRSVESLARMVVELEEDVGCVPEFEYNDHWPKNVAHLKVAG